jgi:hypothetical protein
MEQLERLLTRILHDVPDWVVAFVNWWIVLFTQAVNLWAAGDPVDKIILLIALAALIYLLWMVAAPIWEALAAVFAALGSIVASIPTLVALGIFVLAVIWVAQHAPRTLPLTAGVTH